MPLSSPIVSQLPGEVRESLRLFLSQVRKVGQDSVAGILLYGSIARGEYIHTRSNINIFLLVKACSLEFLRGCGTYQREWRKANIPIPLSMTTQELIQSAHVFPLEYSEIKEQHILLVGQNPFPSLQIVQENLAWQCEQEILGNLFRVRQRFMEGLGRPEAVHALLPIALTALIPCLRGLYRLLGIAPQKTHEAVLSQLQEVLQVDPAVFQEVSHLKRGLASPGTKELPHLCYRYTQALETLICRVQTLKSEGRL